MKQMEEISVNTEKVKVKKPRTTKTNKPLVKKVKQKSIKPKKSKSTTKQKIQVILNTKTESNTFYIRCVQFACILASLYISYFQLKKLIRLIASGFSMSCIFQLFFIIVNLLVIHLINRLIIHYLDKFNNVSN